MMKTKRFERPVVTLACVLALGAFAPASLLAAESSMLDGAKGAATDAGSAVKSSAESAAGTVADTAKNATARLGGKDALFVRKAAIGGMAEVKSAELAKDKASSSDVKTFAEQMIKDHTAANQELESLAKDKNITVPTELDNKHQAKVDKLSNLSGSAFDREYVLQQRMGHAKMLDLLQDEAKNGKDPDIKAFAAKASDVVSEHKTDVEKLKVSSR